MGLQEVIGEVESGADRRAQAILDEAKAEADAILAAARDKVEAYAKERQAQAERQVEQLHGQSESHAEFEARKIVLEAESGLRRELWRSVVEGFAGLPRKTRDAHLKKLLATAKGVVPKGKVWGAESDKAFLKKDKTFDFAGTVDIAGGLIVESADGSIRVDLSYETLLRDQWRDILRAESALFS